MGGATFAEAGSPRDVSIALASPSAVQKVASAFLASTSPSPSSDATEMKASRCFTSRTSSSTRSGDGSLATASRNASVSSARDRRAAPAASAATRSPSSCANRAACGAVLFEAR